jgi:hypothetical protein
MMKHCIIAYLIAFFTVLPAAANPPAKVGDKAKNLKVLPPWTMKLCPTVLHATYGPEGALKLKGLDNDCALWRAKAGVLDAQTADFKAATGLLKKTIETFQAEQKLDQVRIQDLTKQLKAEIAEKNKYKYKPTYGWLYISIGAALAAVGIAFGVGVWVAKKE